MNTLQPGDGGLFAEVRQLNTSNGRGRGKQHCLRGAATFPGEANVHTLCAEASTSSVRRPRGNPESAVPSARSRLLGTHRSQHSALLLFICDRINYPFKDKGR